MNLAPSWCNIIYLHIIRINYLNQFLIIDYLCVPFNYVDTKAQSGSVIKDDGWAGGQPLVQ